MIDKVIIACERMGLVCREDGDVFLNPQLPEEARLAKSADLRLPLTICELVCDPARSENHKLAQLIAWYLHLDPLDAPGHEKAVVAALEAIPALQHHFDLKDLTYGQFEDWIVYLGFAWAGTRQGGKRAICPDPTSYLRRNVSAIFETDPAEPVSAAEVVRRIAQLCPLLEGGTHRNSALALAGAAEEATHLSAATSQAWLRLADEGFWELTSQSDAGETVVLADGSLRTQVASVKIRSTRPTKRKRNA